MASLVRRALTLSLIVAVAATVLSVGSASSRTASGPNPTLYVLYAQNCTFTIQDDAGNTVTAIAPGAYQVEVRTPFPFGTYPQYELTGPTDMTACRGVPQFQLTGPGVSISTTMSAGCQSDLTFPETFAPSATYVAQDNNQPSVTRTTFTTLATGTPTPAPKTYGNDPTKNESSSSLIGSKAHSSSSGKLTGTLMAELTAKGGLTLMDKGKPVSKLLAGRYTFMVTDLDAKGGFTIQAPKLGSTQNLTSVKFVGHKKVTVALKAGTWMFYSGLGKIHRFVVTVAPAT